MTWWTRLRRWTRFQYLRLVRQPASAHSLAVGLAAGVFAGFLPIIPFQMAVAVALALPVRGSKVAAALGTWVSNPVNVIPLYALMYWVGGVFVATDAAFDPAHLAMRDMLTTGMDFFLVMCLGGVVMGIPASCITYVLAFRGVNAYRHRRMIKLMRAWQARQPVATLDAAQAAPPCALTGDVGAEDCPTPRSPADNGDRS